ncbi:hypothetical protein FA13DRAFT_1787035 [Coprinellus micaceus]|uniref:Uncharacterized protein n=1 Tax=Coprinellus micaceus TaxID=71717 RepID=A0A4Y7TR44_COPMI|nr:hypothetical protein FA13DRAFT_1787035 [Coprinellus micaceus]
MAESMDYFNLNVVPPLGSDSKPTPSIHVYSSAYQPAPKVAKHRPQPRSLESTRDINQHRDTIERIAKAFA